MTWFRHLSVLMVQVAALAVAAPAAAADSVENAFRLCAVFDATGLPSEPCGVSGWHSAVDVRLDTNSAEARKICAGVVVMAT